jgi:hypothetical protein
MSRAQILMAPTTDPDAVVYHTRIQMTEKTQYGMRGDHNTELGEVGAWVLGMDGVVAVSVGPYNICVKKSPIFDWDEVRPSIEKLLMSMVESNKALMGAMDEIKEIYARGSVVAA